MLYDEPSESNYTYVQLVDELKLDATELKPLEKASESPQPDTGTDGSKPPLFADSYTGYNTLDSDLRLPESTEDSSSGTYTFHERFRSILTLEDGPSRRKLLVECSDLFVKCALRDGVTIIDELHQQVPDNLKKIKPASLGGVAGGQKFIKDSIIYKLASDPQLPNKKFLYGDERADPQRAAKAASNELMSASRYFRFFYQSRMLVNVPLQMLVDYMGYRLVCMALLPLKGSRLIYGSDDGGRTVKNEVPDFSHAMALAGTELHLAPHRVGDVVLSTAGDVEGHLGRDGAYFLLDLSRTFPPEGPLQTTHLPLTKSAVFFRLFRPEYLQHLRQLHEKGQVLPDGFTFPPLSSDSFSLWGRHSSPFHNQHAAMATHYLFQTCVPQFAANLVERAFEERVQINKVFDELGGRIQPVLESRNNLVVKLGSGLLDKVAARLAELRAEWLPRQGELASCCEVWASSVREVVTVIDNHGADLRKSNEELTLGASELMSALRQLSTDRPDWVSRNANELLALPSLSSLFHAQGINIRHVNLVRQHVRSFLSAEQTQQSQHGTADKARFVLAVSTKLLLEMVQRSVKHLLRQNLSAPPNTDTNTVNIATSTTTTTPTASATTATTTATAAVPKTLVCDFFNRLIEKDAALWERLASDMEANFGFSNESGMDLHDVMQGHLGTVVLYACRSCGISLESSLLHSLRSHPVHLAFELVPLLSTLRPPSLLTSRTIEDVGPRQKFITFVELVHAQSCVDEALAEQAALPAPTLVPQTWVNRAMSPFRRPKEIYEALCTPTRATALLQKAFQITSELLTSDPGDHDNRTLHEALEWVVSMMPNGTRLYNITHLQQFVEQLQAFCLERRVAIKKAKKHRKSAKQQQNANPSQTFLSSSPPSPSSTTPCPPLRLQLAVAAAKSQALGLAADMGKRECAEYLLQAQADVKWCDDLGRTALYRACYVGHLGLVELLLAYGAEPNTRSQTRLDPLTVAAFKGHVEVAERLIEAKADINPLESPGASRNMALQYATSRVSEVLRRHGAKHPQPLIANKEHMVMNAAAYGDRNRASMQTIVYGDGRNHKTKILTKHAVKKQPMAPQQSQMPPTQIYQEQDQSKAYGDQSKAYGDESRAYENQSRAYGDQGRAYGDRPRRFLSDNRAHSVSSIAHSAHSDTDLDLPE